MQERPIRSALLVPILMLLSSGVALSDTYTFSLIPQSGDIGGAAGSTIGWGYRITNNSATNWLDPLSVNAGIFRYATLNIGDYFSYQLIAPNTTVAVSFAPAIGSGFGTGLAALTLSSNAPIGFVNSGQFDLGACWANNTGTCLANAPDSFEPYSATAQTPEPGNISTLLLAALVFFALTLIASPAEFRTICLLNPLNSKR